MKTIAALIATASFATLIQPIQTASAASYNCRSTSLTKTEQAICSDPSLSALDTKLSSLYTGARADASDSDKAAIVNTQKAWVAKRNQCLDTPCLIDAYNSRISQLSTSLPSSSIATASSSSATIARSLDASVASGVSTANSNLPITTAYITSLDAEKKASINLARSLLSKQIGFKDYRLGKAIATAQEIPGIKSCGPALKITQPSADFHAEAIKVVHARWDAIIDDFSACDAATTVLEKPASVSLMTFGDPAVTVGITLTVDSADLDAISELLTKSLGAPKDTKITTTADEARKQVQQDELKQCDEIARSFHETIGVPGTENARCRGEMQGRVLMRMSHLPPEGIVQGSRSWTVEGAQVGYDWINVGDHPTTVIKFYVDQARETSIKLTEAVRRDLNEQEAIAKKAEAATKAKDF